MAQAVRRPKVLRTDWGMLIIALVLVVSGLVMVYSASYGFSLVEEAQRLPATYFVQRQATFVAMGMVAMLLLWRIDYRLYRKYAVHILALTIIVLVVMAFVGRWFLQGNRSVQPVEAAKIGAMVYIAVWLASKGLEIRNLNLGMIPFALLLGTIAGLIVIQPDFSTAVLLVATATTMFFVAGADMKQLLIAFLFGGVALVLVALTARYRFERIDLWLSSPFSDVLGKGFQPVQALVALNKGGWLGVGLGQSQQKFAIYAPHTDGMFAIIGEELGFVGAVTVMLVYGLWTWRGLRLALRAADSFGMLLAVGLVSWVTFQAMLHIAVITASTPFTGTVMPFISYGGSSIVASLAQVGILLSISRSSHGVANEEARG